VSAPTDLPRREALPDGRTLVVRAARSDDVDAVAALYEALPRQDRYRRFFSGFHPGRAFVAHWLDAGSRGGCSLVATVGAAVVGEAGFTPLPDGGAEFAITVAEAWRGWLGPYLLDVLVDEARRLGVTVLEAEVLVENRPMLTLAARRGQAVLDRPDWTVVRVAVATDGRVPPWPPLDGRPRVLVEAPGGRWRGDAELRAAGFSVAGCAGPGRAGGPCPALAGEPCPLAAGAAVIVCALPPGDPRTAELLAAHARLDPGVAVLCDGGPADELGACRAGPELVRRVERAVAATR